MSLLAPAGMPVSPLDVLKWIPRLAMSRHYHEKFKQTFQDKFQLANSFYITTGRAAMSVALQCMAEFCSNSTKNEIIVPAYTCYSVPSSVLKAGLKVRVCDIDPKTLSYDREKLTNFDFTNVLGIVTANLYGIPDELDFITNTAKEKDLLLLDDAAQCLGGKVNGKYSGTLGDIGLYSLDKGKNFTTMQGGIITSRHKGLTNIIENHYRSLDNSRAVDTVKDSIKLLAYMTILPPSIYWITQHLPFLNLGATRYEDDYPVRRYSPALGTFGYGIIQKYEEYKTTRNKNAEFLSEHLSDLKTLKMITYHDNVEPVYIRFPLLAQTSQQRETLINTFISSGIMATRSYPLSVNKIPEIQTELHTDDKTQPGGEYVAERILTLPVHPYVKNHHLAMMIDTIKKSDMS